MAMLPENVAPCPCMQVRGVLLAHLLPLPRLSLEVLAAAGAFPTALAQVNGSGLYNLTVAKVGRCCCALYARCACCATCTGFKWELLGHPCKLGLTACLSPRT